MPSKSSLVPDFLGQVVNDGRLRLERVLGSGAYGVCYAAKSLDEEGGPGYAVKALIKTGLDERQRMFQRRELKLHANASAHPGVVTLHRTFEEKNCVFLVLDLAESDLFTMITEKHIYLGRDTLIRHIFCQLIDAVEYCHLRGIYHRDLKPENILCANGGAKVMLSDFGLATNDPVSRDFGCGSSYYMSPETYGGIFHHVSAYATRQNDIWALGVILVNLTCGRNPWRQAAVNDDTFRAYIENPDFLPHILPVSYDCNEILKRIFTLDPQERITLPELRQAICQLTRFTMTSEELKRAPDACKAAARAAWSSAQKATRRNPVVVPAIIIEEHISPNPNNAVAPCHNDDHPLGHVQTSISSAGSEHKHPASSITGHYQPSSSVAAPSVTSPYHAVVQAVEVEAVSSTSSNAESAGPITPEYHPNGDATVGLPDIGEDPLALDATPAPVVTQKVPITQQQPVGKLSAIKETPNSMRGVRDLLRKVRF